MDGGITVVCKKHWIMLVKPAIIEWIIFDFLRNMIILRSAKGQAMLKGTSLEHILGVKTLTIVILILLIPAVLIALYNILLFLTDGIRLTEKGDIVYRTPSANGIIPSDYVQNVEIDQGLLGMILGYSTITLVCWGANASEIKLKHARKGKELAAAVNAGYTYKL